MNHGNKVNHLGRTASHRKAMLSNMAGSLIIHKKITTTVAKAKELRKFVEPLITKAKDDTTHSRRMVFSALKHKDPVKELFGDVAAKVADRPGGYTRILRTGNRLGDNAELCIMELVDYNETYTTGKKAPAKTRRKRAAGAKKSVAKPAAEVSEENETAVAAPAAGKKSKAKAPKAEANATPEVPEIEQPGEGTPDTEDSAKTESAEDAI